MSKKLNLIFSILSLVTTTILLIVTVYSWYTQNEVVTVKSIVGQTENQDTNYELYYWKTSESKWVVATEIQQRNVLPGSTTYFKLACTNSGSAPVKLTAKFQGIQSKLDTNYVKVSADGKYITYNGIKTYDVANNQVTVEPVVENGDTKNVLYIVDAQKNISLRHFEIKDGYVIQKYGQTETHSGAITKRDNVTSSSNVSNIADSILNEQIIPVGTTNYYFSLTFLDDDDKDKYFMYQELYIDSLTMFEDK